MAGSDGGKREEKGEHMTTSIKRKMES